VIPTDRIILVRTLYGEARGEPRAGQVAVAWTVLNRARADLHGDGRPDWWGEGVAGVCLKQWQYSCWNHGDPNLKAIAMAAPERPAFAACADVVRAIEAGEEPDPTGGATHYHRAGMLKPPDWAFVAGQPRPSVRIGNHLFYSGVER